MYSVWQSGWSIPCLIEQSCENPTKSCRCFIPYTGNKRQGSMNIPDFLKQKVAIFKDFSTERLKQLVDGSRAVSFETNQAIAHQGEAAVHFWVVLSGTVAASVT